MMGREKEEYEMISNKKVNKNSATGRYLSSLEKKLAQPNSSWGDERSRKSK